MRPTDLSWRLREIAEGLDGRAADDVRRAANELQRPTGLSWRLREIAEGLDGRAADDVRRAANELHWLAMDVMRLRELVAELAGAIVTERRPQSPSAQFALDTARAERS